MSNKPVLFVSERSYVRAENIRAVYDAYQGEKDFFQLDLSGRNPLIRSGKYDLMVCDEYVRESPGKMILLWHAIAGGKKIGLDQPRPYYKERNAKNITYAIASGTQVVKMVAQQCGIPDSSVLPLGMPRTDKYVGKRKGDGRTELAKKRSYLYAPTFRSRGETSLPEINWDWLDNELTDEEMLVVKPHMNSKRMLRKSYYHIREVDKDVPSDIYLYDCDVLITDYSTIMTDGYLLGKPCVILEKIRGYTESRGMYFNYPAQYSSRYCTNEREMLRLAREADGLTKVEHDWIKLVADRCDGNATKRVCDLIRAIQ